MNLNETHDPNRRSFLAAANEPGCDFPIQNLPLCIFRRTAEPARGGIAIGDQVLDLTAALAAGLFVGQTEEAARAAAGPALNPLMALGNRHASALRARAVELLSAGNVDEARVRRALVPAAAARFEVPARVGTFTDFLCSIDHTLRMSRTGELPPAFGHLPIAYHSHASTVTNAATIHRPNVQFRDKDGVVRFAPEPSLDFELEMAAWVGIGNVMGEPVPLAAAPDRIFGYCLLNDWSARGIQGWESVPLGPFLGKSFATSISPFVVTAEALLPFRTKRRERTADEPEPFAYLTTPEDAEAGGLDLALTAYLVTPRMRLEGSAPAVVTRTNFRHMYWSFAQMLTHHASNGCSLQPGDLLGSGTTSGPTDESRACLAEISQRGTTPLKLPNGETRAFLDDGDEVIFRGRAERNGFVGIGFGECRARISPAVEWPIDGRGR
jgi:fumarylacetoacetase